ncbi:MAG TPA: response regulator [Gemmataceae bacterium]|nr:response regulator [Gemmataceae bacterium]
MTARTIATLHIEDDAFQQRVVARLLQNVDSRYGFKITCATTEDAALSAFCGSEFELVILDYQLAQGNGLSCLQHIRRLDSVVPVIAMSATASAEIAAALVKAGADDFLAKQNLSAKVLGQSVCAALQRADVVRSRLADLSTSRNDWARLVDEALEHFVVGVGGQWLQDLDNAEHAARQASISGVDLQKQIGTWACDLEERGIVPAGQGSILVRPVLMELLLRLDPDPATSQIAGRNQ